MLIFCPGASAEILKYVDGNGTTKFVDRIEAIPDEYRDQVENIREFISPNTTGESASNDSQKQAQIVKDVEIFVTEWCPYCRKLEAFLKKNRIKYTKYDVEKSALGKQKFAKIGGSGIPVTKVGDRIIRGYDPERILQLIRD